MKKELVGVVVFIIIMVSIILVGINRIDRINNGDMTLVNQNQMDR